METNNFGNLVVKSADFLNNSPIPSDFTCDGKDNIPSLEVSGIDQKAKSLVVIMDDPDAPSGVWVHWVKFNIPVSGEKFVVEKGVEPNGVSGVGTSGNLSYEGPCPPDKEHRYFFKVYSLDSMLNLPEGSTKSTVENAMNSHILQKGELIGLYNRQK